MQLIWIMGEHYNYCSNSVLKHWCLFKHNCCNLLLRWTKGCNFSFSITHVSTVKVWELKLSCVIRNVFQDIFEISTEIKLLQSRNLTIFGNLNLYLLKIKPVKNKLFALQKNPLLFSEMLMWRIWIKVMVKIGYYNLYTAFIVKWITNIVIFNIAILSPK